MWGVAADVDLDDLPDDPKPWMLVQRIVDWVQVERVEEHTDDDGDTHTHEVALWFPVMLDPCKGGDGHVPGLPYFGPVHVSETYKAALRYANKVLRELRKERDEMFAGIEKLTAEAAAAQEK